MAHTTLITGAAGFIGSHLTERLLADGDRVVGLDNFDPFYPRTAKERNLASVRDHDAFTLVEGDIRDEDVVERLFAEHRPSRVAHIAALAGVRPSIERPEAYASVNVDGATTLFAAAARHGVDRFVFASSSSVYGNNEKIPFAESDAVDHPISPYAATKRAAELLAHTFWSLHGVPIVCLRFFTVYGPRQRPDLAIMKFMRMIASGAPIPVFGDGSTSRDYTYVDDIIAGVLGALEHGDAFGIYNLGHHEPITLTDLIREIETVVGREAIIDRRPMQPGDVDRTYADITRARAAFGYAPSTPIRQGLARQWAWLQAVEAGAS